MSGCDYCEACGGSLIFGKKWYRVAFNGRHEAAFDFCGDCWTNQTVTSMTNEEDS